MINRIYKFRAWDKWNNKFCYFNVGNPGQADLDGLGIFKEVQKQQYTEHKDKNNVEIYEGDIVKYEWTEEYDGIGYKDEVLIDVVKYIPEMATFEPVNWMIGDPNIKPEVIGNVFENPELLEDNA